TVASSAPSSSIVYILEYDVTHGHLSFPTRRSSDLLTGDDPNGDPLTPGEDDVEVPGIQSPSFRITKTADRTEFDTAGDKITYTRSDEHTSKLTSRDKIVTGVLFQT